MSDLKINVVGFDDLKNKIIDLAKDKDKKAEILLILRQVAQPTLRVAQGLVPVSKKAHKARGKLIQPGNLQKSLGLIVAKSENPTIALGARTKGNNDGWYAHFVHEGVNTYNKGYKRKHTAGANNHAAVSHTTGNPFLKRALEATQGTVTADAEKRVSLFIQRRIDKLSK